MMNEYEEVKIAVKKRDWDRLNERSHWLACLESAGVDNWEGISYAYQLRQEDEEKESIMTEEVEV